MAKELTKRYERKVKKLQDEGESVEGGGGGSSMRCDETIGGRRGRRNSGRRCKRRNR